jgi:hypothetical protein
MMVPVTEALTKALTAAHTWLKKTEDVKLNDAAHVVPASDLLEELAKAVLSASSSVPVGSSAPVAGARFKLDPGSDVLDVLFGAVDLLNQHIAPKREFVARGEHEWDKWMDNYTTSVRGKVVALYGLIVDSVHAAAIEDLDALVQAGPGPLLDAVDALGSAAPKS